MAGPEAYFLAIVDLFVANWPQISIGMLLGVLLAWKRWVPSKWAQLKNAVTKRSYGVLYVRLKSKVFKPVVIDFSAPNGIVKTPYGSYNATGKIGGYQDGVPLSFANQTDVDAVPLFKNDYHHEDLINPSDLSDGIEAAYIAGQISQQKEDKLAFYMRIATLLGLAVVILLVWDQRSTLTAIAGGINNFAASTADNFAKLLGGGIQKGG